METGSARTNYARTDAAPRRVVASDLAPSQTVTAAGNAAATRLDPVRATFAQQALGGLVDPRSREVLYRAMDVRSARSVRQAREEALKLKAYRRAVAEPSEENSGFERTA